MILAAGFFMVDSIAFAILFTFGFQMIRAEMAVILQSGEEVRVYRLPPFRGFVQPAKLSNG
jgi:hypothetical protein